MTRVMRPEEPERLAAQAAAYAAQARSLSDRAVWWSWLAIVAALVSIGVSVLGLVFG